MDSLRTTSANSSAAHEVSAEASSSSIPHNPVQSSSPSPTTVRKKKGGSWNIWGLNGLQKQKTIHSWIQKHNLDIFGLLETKIAASNLADIETKLTPPHWKYFSNIASSLTCRILVGWNPQQLHLTCIHSSSQWLTCEAVHHNFPSPVRITFIYGHNTPVERQSLWHYIVNESTQTTCPWTIMGYFNAIMHAGDKSGGDTSWPRHQDDFKNCITQSNLLQAPYTGLKYFWHNGQHGSQTIQKKLDWVFGNPQLFSTWPATHAIFQPRSISDHSAMLLNLQSPSQHPTSPFKFLNIWADRSDFIATVATSWQLPVYGNPMYQLTTKLRRLKIDLKMFHWQNTSNITGRVRNRIHSLQDDTGNTIHDPQELGRMASSYFENWLCAPHLPVAEELNPIFPNTITEASATTALLPITNDDIQAALFSIPDTRAPGPDGYNALFFKKSWDVIKYDFIAAIKYFFSNNSLPRCVNATRVALVPKQEQPRKRFIDVYPLRTLTATGLPWNAQVSTIIQDGQWHFPRDVPAIQPTLNSIHFYPNPTSKDTYTWKGHIPRHSFILWLACLGRLHTMDRLSAAGIIQNASCILCGLQTETHEHLFFNYTTSRQVWQTVNTVATIYWPSCNWSDLLQWGAVNYNKKNDVQHLIVCLLLTTTVYHLWQERNKRVFSNQYQSASTLAEEVFQQVRLQLTTMKFSGRIPQTICNIWGLMDSPPA
uniref:Uncharacterized protein n=1 Tax=Populus alba TaxID=43335 RepID=A0A4U5QCC8_POPAL|nr:hypothetical protein D5086_0000121650 [Populus alba]